MINNKVNIYHNKIYEFLDFLTEKEHVFFLNMIQNANEEDWPSAVDNEYQKNDNQISGTVLELSQEQRVVANKIDDRIQKLFKNAGRINQVSAIQRYKPFTGMGTHVDDALDPTVLFGVVIYLNDDYTGGEINYPSLNLTIKPVAKSMIIHPANMEHQVLPVSNQNTRYILSVFVRGDGKTEIIYGQ
jgi:predicted 2-oxoglutarate/Fe(II)-dependent dioxygenase YbiX